MKSALSVEIAVLSKAFRQAGEGLGLDDTELSAVLGEPVSKLKPGTEAWSQALIFVELYQGLLAVVGNEQSARIWLSSENHALGGRPRDLIACRTGLEQIVKYLASSRP